MMTISRLAHENSHIGRLKCKKRLVQTHCPLLLPPASVPSPLLFLFPFVSVCSLLFSYILGKMQVAKWMSALPIEDELTSYGQVR
ncbi:hypothetical protein AU210_015959 [Fusarium oxysporum f. sp. radicis-cucumerinum]|uniref:Uncharacterized protein n=1 Tax=Fusarium oxysporum f. sp. radicis-cucumerinum TaxID=327505 RepID=A0A2H3FVU5_FUSOX|nr:hypothetical protein AU210_015959 [Fusarium oxysporum f. sp. radicis-cucumerinum]